MSARTRRILPGMHGVLLVDKPQDHTSHDVVARVRRASGFVRCGHAGTLDPMATGVLPILLGDATRVSDWLMEHDKEYEFTLRFGVVTDTCDAWGRTLEERPVPALGEKDVADLVARFTGEQSQVPPMYSAVKVGGRRLHEEARRGRDVERPARTVSIYAIDVLAWETPFLRLRISCSKGTYIRSLAHDMGQALGCGACVTELRRLRAGTFRVEDAAPLEAVLNPEAIAARLIPIARALPDFGRVVLDAASIAALADGRAVEASGTNEEGTVFLMDAAGRTLALAMREGDRFRPLRVFAGALSENKEEKGTCNSADICQNPVSGG